MQPVFNPYLRPNANNTPPANPQPPQVFLGQNSMQTQPQMGIINPQFPVPFNNPNVFSTNNEQMQNILPFLNQQQQQQPGNYVNANANANLLGVLQMALFAQNQINNLNALGMLLNQPQQQGQMFAPSWPNQNMGYPNFQNPVQNMNPAVPVGPLQLPNFPQAASFNVPPGSHQMGGHQDPNFFANSIAGVGEQVRPNQHNFPMPTMGANALQPLPAPTQQVEANSSGMQQAQNSQPFGLNRWQENGQGSSPNSNWKNNPRKNFRKDFNQGASQSGHQKLQFHHTDNKKRKFGFPNNERKGKGHGNERAGKNGCINPVSQAVEKKRRRLPFIYTEQEIKRWRDARRKNYPSSANIEQKRARKAKSSEVIDRETKLLREQLKEVVEKQVELGCEVAEIPEQYLSDSTKDLLKGKGNGGSLPKKGKKHNRHGKRGKKKDKNSRNTPADINAKPTHISANIEKKPTLLQQLLSADIRKDNSYLLQVLRFMVLNSFFKDWPKKPLEFPLVVYEEDGCQTEFVGGKSVLDSGENDDDDDNSSEDDGKANENTVLPEQGSCFTTGNSSRDGEGHRTQEEGEIVD